MRTAIVVTLAVGMLGAALSPPSRVDDLAGVELDLTLLVDSTSYFVYRYDLTNPPASTWGLVALRVDIGASSGTPSPLASSGTFFDDTDSPGPLVEPHAEVGPITPAPWSATLRRDAKLSWYPRTGVFTSDDSVAPGETRSGFGIRSSYLPGISEVVATPTRESCCTVPDSTDDGIFYPPPARFAVTGWTVAPRYMQSEVDVELLEAQVNAACNAALWIGDAPLCTQLADSLAAADSLLGLEDYSGASATISSFRDIVLANGPPTGDIAANAFWLLSVNAQQLLANLAPEPGRVPGSRTRPTADS